MGKIHKMTKRTVALFLVSREKYLRERILGKSFGF